MPAWCPGRLLEAEDPEENPLKELFQPIPKLFRPFYGERFEESDALIFVGACGIAVREIAPFVKSKKTDPAVICVDDKAQYVIPVLSGHIGGANELAARLANALGALAVITTATDINNRFSVDAWAARNGLAIDNLKAAKDVSAAILDRDIPILCKLPVPGNYPNGTYAWKPENRDDCQADSIPPLGIYIGWKKEKPFPETLRLIPKVLTLGIGCRKGIEKEAVRAAVDAVMKENHIDVRAIEKAASIDIKSEENGLLSFCEEAGLAIHFYSAEELKTAKGDFSPSEFVQSITGVDNVCERAAMMQAEELIVKKTALNGVTVAVGLRLPEISFSENGPV